MAINAAVNSPADMVNLALRRIGYRLRVGNLYEGSFAAGMALDIYAQERDSALQEGNWNFAERNVALTLLKTAPAGGYIPPIFWSSTYPPLPYLFEYDWPSDALEIRAVKPTPIFVPVADPQYNSWDEYNDNSYTPAKKTIVCNVPSAIAVYVGQITDPATWQPAFVEFLASSLAKRLAPVLANIDAVKLEAADEAQQKQLAEMQQGDR